MAQILIVEDEELLAKSLSRYLTGRGNDCCTASSAEEGLKSLEKMQMDVVLLDLQLPGMSGLEAIQKFRDQDPNPVVIISTAHGTMAAAVEAMRNGASDFLRKPLAMEEVTLSVERAIANARIQQKIAYYHERDAIHAEEDALIYNSSKMKEVTTFLEKILKMRLPNASDYPPILILGETGTGKDLIARTAHYQSHLSGEAFIEVNCSTLPSGLEEAELFGFEKGAFTGASSSKRGLFEAAQGGTMFLNEIGDMTPEAQVKLLQVIERKTLRRIGGLRDIPLDVRIIAASNRDLQDTKNFRDDLYSRLHNLTIKTPPLRERIEDIGELAELFLKKFCRKYGVEKRLSDEAQRALADYNWPGNVRELHQLMERVTFLSPATEVSFGDLNLPESKSVKVDFSPTGDFQHIDFHLITQAGKFIGESDFCRQERVRGILNHFRCCVICHNYRRPLFHSQSMNMCDRLNSLRRISADYYALWVEKIIDGASPLGGIQDYL